MKYYFSLVLTLISFSVFAQSDSLDSAPKDTLTIDFISYWSKGDNFRFKITKIKENSQAENNVSDTVEYHVKWLVVSAKKDKYTIEWLYEDDWLNNYHFSEEMKAEYAKLFNRKLVYETNELGQFIGLKNWKEIAKQNNKLLNEWLNKYKSDKEKMQLLKGFIETMSSKEAIEGFYLKDIQLFHYPFGVALKENKLYEYEDELPNLFGGEPILANCRTQVYNVNEESKVCYLDYTMNVSVEETQKMLKDVFSNLSSAKNNIQWESFLKNSQLNVEDETEFVFNYEYGIPYQLYSTRTVYIKILDSKEYKKEFTLFEMEAED